MRYKVLKDFKGSPDGRFAVDYKAGETVELTASLSEVALAEKWVETVAEEVDAKPSKPVKHKSAAPAVPSAPTSAATE